MRTHLNCSRARCWQQQRTSRSLLSLVSPWFAFIAIFYIWSLVSLGPTMTRVTLLAPAGVNAERHAYCLCLHVRPATIFVALINLGGSLLCAFLTLFLMANTDFKSNSVLTHRFMRDAEMNRISAITVLMYLLLSLVSAMLLYGVIKSKPRYILPFFGIQFIDYLFTMPQFLAALYAQPYHYYLSKKEIVGDVSENQLGEAGNDWQSASEAAAHVYSTSLMFMILILVFKTYFLCVVWKCYRYLHMKELILPLTLNHTFASESMMGPIVITSVPPPNYEEATKMPDFQPPDYQTAVDNQAPVPEASSIANQQQEQTQSKTT